MGFPELAKLDNQCKWLSLTSPAFDISLLEFLCPILMGGELVLACDEAGERCFLAQTGDISFCNLCLVMVIW